MRIGLLDYDSKQVNLALMKLSTWHKAHGDTVILNPTPEQVDKTYISVIFDKNRAKVAELAKAYPNVEIGGTGWDLTSQLPTAVETSRPDYDLYKMENIYGRLKGIMTQETKRKKAQVIVDAGIGFLSRGCVRNCGFCVVPKKEGKLHKVAELKDLINPRSNVITLLDNNLTANPDALEVLKEISERGLVIDLTQGLDVRTMTPEMAEALSKVKFLRSIHYAWDLMPFEHKVLQGIETLSQFVKKWRHMCFMLVGYDTSFEQDYYRFQKLAKEVHVDPYVMIYNKNEPTAKLKHFARWVNGRIYKKCTFEQYVPWMDAQTAAC
jgi:hypothetical protein